METRWALTDRSSLNSPQWYTSGDGFDGLAHGGGCKREPFIHKDFDNDFGDIFDPDEAPKPRMRTVTGRFLTKVTTR